METGPMHPLNVHVGLLLTVFGVLFAIGFVAGRVDLVALRVLWQRPRGR